MINKTMCEVLWRNISDFYVHLRVEVGKHPQVLIWVWTATFSQVILAFISIKTEFYVVLLYNFKIIVYDKHFENIQAEHATELISFEIQCFDSTFVDKLFNSVFKSLRFEKHISKSYFKITTINYISFCYPW